MDQLRTHDSLNRRQRTRPQTTGKAVSPQPRDLIWFQKLHEHGPLPSGFLHAFTKKTATNEKRAKERLTDLFNEDRTRHKGRYLDRPFQQFQTIDARYQPLVYDLTPAALRALKDNRLLSEYAPKAAGPWRHRFMVACVTASIELETLDRPDIAFIPQHQILKRAQAKLRYSVAIKDPRSNKEVRTELVPDALFGLEYRRGRDVRYRFFLVEADRATEPTRTSQFNRKSHLRSFLQYRDYIGRGHYKDHLGLTSGLLVLNVTSLERTAQAQLRLLDWLSETGNTYQLFQTIEGFGGIFKPPSQPLSGLLKGEWMRAGHEPFRIDRP